MPTILIFLIISLKNHIFYRKLSLKTPLCPYVASIMPNSELHKWAKVRKALISIVIANVFFLVDI